MSELFIENVNFAQLECQKYWNFPASYSQEKKKEFINNAFFGLEYIGSRKYDGALYRFVKDDNGNMALLSRSRNVQGEFSDKLELVPHLFPFFDELPNGTCLLGELVFPENEGSNNVTKIMGCKPDKAIERQKDSALWYYVFDVLAYAGEVLLNKTILDRIEYIKNPDYLGTGYNVFFAEYYEGKALYNYYYRVLEEGGEGVVLTRKDAIYEPGKRPARKTLKLKKQVEDTLDVVIMGANAPTKEYGGKDIENWKYWINETTGTCLPEGEHYFESQNGAPYLAVTKKYYYKWAGSLIIGMRKDNKIVPIGNLSGLDDEVLEHFKDYVGRVAEISCMEIMPTGGLRHPVFLKWREDKVPRDTDYYRYWG